MPADDDFGVFFPDADDEHDRIFDRLDGSGDIETVDDRAIKSGSGSSVLAVVAAIAGLGWLALSGPSGDQVANEPRTADSETPWRADAGDDPVDDLEASALTALPSRSMLGTLSFKTSVRDGLLQDCERHLAPVEPYFESWPEYERCVNYIMSELEEICVRSATAQFFVPNLEQIDLACRTNPVG